MEQKDSTTIDLQALLAGLSRLPDYERRIASLEGEVATLRAANAQQTEAPIIPKGRKFATCKEAAKILGVSIDTVRRYIDRKLLSRNAASRYVLIPVEDLESFGGKVTL